MDGEGGCRETLSPPHPHHWLPVPPPLPVISTPPWVVSNLVFVHHQPITWQPCPYPQRRRDAAAWWGFCILNSISWWDKGCRNRALPLCKISVSHKPFLAASSDTDCGEKRHWAWQGGNGVGMRGGCSEMGPNFTMIFLLFLICYQAPRSEKLHPAPKCVPVFICGKSTFHFWDQYSNSKKTFSPSSPPLTVGLPNTRYYSADR